MRSYQNDDGSGVTGCTGRAGCTSARGVRNGMRAGFRQDQARGEEESRIQSSASGEDDRGQSSAGQARGEEKDRGRSGGLAEEGGRSEEEGGDWPGGSEEEGGRRAQGRKRLTEEGRRASEEGRHPKAARPEGEVIVAGVRDEALLVGARGLRRTGVRDGTKDLAGLRYRLVGAVCCLRHIDLLVGPELQLP